MEERCNRTMSEPAKTWEGSNELKMVPLAGLEPAFLSELDFESECNCYISLIYIDNIVYNFAMCKNPCKF
jgi:hypothetical protein